MLFGWYIVGYLFLAGAGSGAFFVSECCCVIDAVRKTDSSERLAASVQPGFYAAPCLLLVAGLFLLLDLGNPERVWQIAFAPARSVMSLGAWFVALLTLVSGALAVAGAALPEVPKALQRACCVLGMPLALGTMSYTGILLAGMVGIDFWRSPWLVALFVASSLSTGTSTVLLLDALIAPPSVAIPSALRRAAWAFSFAEACVLAVFLATQYGFSDVARASCDLLLSGELSPAFWGGVCLVGLAAPLAIGAVSHALPERPTVISQTVGVLAGGASLRFCIVSAALYTPLALGAAAVL